MTAPALSAQVQGVGSVSADNYNTYQQTCSSIAELRAFVGLPGIEVLVRGLVTPNDGGAGLFIWASSITSPDDGVNYIIPPGAGGGGWVRNLTSGAFGIQANIVAAATTNIGVLGSNNVYITGVATINSFGATAKVVNPVFLLRFASTLTIVNSANIICPGGNNITTTANAFYLAAVISPNVFVITPFLAQAAASYPGFGTQTALVGTSTTDIGTVPTHNVLITGTSSITSFGTTATTSAPVYLLQFQGALTLTYNGTSMILIGGTNITTAANDAALMQYLGSGNWIMLMYQRAAGAPAPAAPSFQYQLFTVSGTFTVPAGTVASTVFKFTLTGGGGSATGASNYTSGGAGATAIYYANGLTAGATVAVTVGAVGTPGSDGGDTSIVVGATTVTAAGGGSNSVGGDATNGTLNITGGDGTSFASGTTNQAPGGASFWGGGTAAYGAGGDLIGTTHYNGGAGVVLVEWIG